MNKIIKIAIMFLVMLTGVTMLSAGAGLDVVEPVQVSDSVSEPKVEGENIPVVFSIGAEVETAWVLVYHFDEVTREYTFSNGFAKAVRKTGVFVGSVDAVDPGWNMLWIFGTNPGERVTDYEIIWYYVWPSPIPD